MSSSRTRLYLDLKLSQSELTRRKKLPYGQFGRYRLNPAKYLKEMTSKWSIFEKPCFSSDGPRAMNLQMPVPDWPSDSGRVSGPPRDPDKLLGFFPLDPDKPSGFFPSTKDYTSTFLFRRGECHFFGSFGSIRCGESISFNLTLDDMRFHSIGTNWEWRAVSSEPDDIRIINTIPHLFGKSVTIEVETNDTFDGIATICVTVDLVSGNLLEKIVFPVPLAWWDPKYEKRWQNLAYMLKTFVPISETRVQDESYDCGCVELEVLCCDDSGIAWDSDNSAGSIGTSSHCTVAITDSLETGGPYSWSVANNYPKGRGFSLANSKTTGLSNTLYTAANACGTAIITVTGCDGMKVTGYVLCTTGGWAYKSPFGLTGLYTGGSLAAGYERIVDDKKQYHKIHHWYTWWYAPGCPNEADMNYWCTLYGYDDTQGLSFPRPAQATGCTWLLPDIITFPPCECFEPILDCGGGDIFGQFWYATEDAKYYEWECA